MTSSRILVVEDEGIVALSINRQLERLGYEVPATLSSGEEAIAYTDREQPDLILMDILLDGELDGIEAAERIRQRHDIPIVYLTANSDDATVARAKATAPHGYILKPFEERELYTIIEMALSKQQLERTIKEERRWLSTILRSISDAVIATDAESSIRFMNAVAERLTGWPESQALGRPLDDVFELIEPQGIEETGSNSAQIALSRAGVFPFSEGAILAHKSGAKVPIDGSASPMVSTYGVMEGVVLVFRDVTLQRDAKVALERAKGRLEGEVAARTLELSDANAMLQNELAERLRAEKALQDHVRQLESRNRELDAFARTVAHDLKDPLNLIVGFAELVAEEADLPEALQGYQQNIIDTGLRMTEITRELLLLARLRDSEVTLHPVDMALVVARGCDRLARMIEERNAELVVTDEWPRALGYGPWLEEVWVNYLSNALKYGGDPPRIELGATLQEDGYVRFWVRDNGPGLSEDERGVVFTEFTRLDPLDHLDQNIAKGHGLGLSIAQRIMDKLGGRLGVESEPGQGSVFYFLLPAILGANGASDEA